MTFWKRLAAASGSTDSPAPGCVPELVRLPVRAGFTASDLPPVSIFVGSERAQFRAERVLLWSIEAVRNPARKYEIHLMRDLAGFRRTGWRTGFSNYRFAVPALAEGRGRAIYNDVDQIYRRDPGELFDLELGDHAALVLSVGSHVDSAVMLLDCDRMAKFWTHDAARSQTKKQLLRKLREAKAAVGMLPAEWHIRDSEWDGRASAHLLHYTTLHTQPWQPEPERYVYRENPHAAVWHELEAQADATGFQIFTRDAPSRSFATQQLAEAPGGFTRTLSPELTEAAEEAEREACADTHRCFEPLQKPQSSKLAGTQTDCGILNHCLEELSQDDIPWILDEAFSASRHVVLAEVFSTPGRSLSRWSDLFAAASRRSPGVHWHLLCRIGDRVDHRRGGHYLGRAEPRVWISSEESTGDATRTLQGLADALGAKWESRSLLASTHEPPWPDLLLISGKRAAHVARRVKQASHARTRVVRMVAGGEGRMDGRNLARRDAIDLLLTQMSDGPLSDPGRSVIPFQSFLELMRREVSKIAYAPRLSRRGTPRPQQSIGRLCACALLLARGFVRPPRELARTQSAQSKSDSVHAWPRPECENGIPLGDLESAARRVRALLGWDGSC
ncbi:MAG: hypothetical protein JRG89_13280 [Deltaproteobacteria bacterium]|nr:hypothetical protein [Deltaproteobacteria bacterium]